MAETKKASVKIDKRIEMLGICLRLSDYHDKFYHLVTDLKNYPYLEEVNKYFSKFKNHKAIKLLNEVIEKLSFSYLLSTPLRLLIYIIREPAIRSSVPPIIYRNIPGPPAEGNSYSGVFSR